MRKTLRSTALALALLGSATACGIRGTAVPVDAGGAPSRASCVVRPEPAIPSGAATVTVQLECTSQLVPVTRAVAETSEDSVAVARVLLEELRKAPSNEEAGAGMSTAVPQRLTVAGPRPGDPAGTLRLAREPGELPQVGLAQLVCTYAGTAAADGKRSVILGGPSGERPKSYACTDELRVHPDSADITGTPVS
ncbi:hypothetical protein [Streptomyces hiroshimensis]|uniref:Lipoprotein n=1 Tax=Streptomyces hiroshimensis TaxID=66424 RepID=A0ABQ2YIW6_9ACTN|nr:hypothetical protein [Streptomyces hiroshimensis]GGX85803.1 lipoprotein [Streptomyces hiroshimensis]